MDNMFSVKGKRILIAGATGGIGTSVSVLLDQLGAELVLVGRNKGKLEALLSKLSNSNSQIMPVDFGSQDEIEYAVSMQAKIKKFDGMVYAAGVQHTMPIRSLDKHDIDSVMSLNFTAFVMFAKAYAKKKNNNGGSVVGISSIMSEFAEPGNSIYSATKNAMDSFAKSCSVEFIKQGIRVNTIRPAFVETDMYKQMADVIDNTVLTKQKLGIIPPEQIAAAVAFLLSDASKYITGICVDINAGYGVN